MIKEKALYILVTIILIAIGTAYYFFDLNTKQNIANENIGGNDSVVEENLEKIGRTGVLGQPVPTIKIEENKKSLPCDYLGEKSLPMRYEKFNASEWVNYLKYENKIYYQGSFFSQAKCIEVVEADPGSFKALAHSLWTGINFAVDYAKDKNSVYFLGKKVDNADPETFEFIPLEYYGKQFVFNYLYSKDSRSVFREGVKLEGLDPQSFKVLRPNYSCEKHGCSEGGLYKDKFGVYEHARPYLGQDKYEEKIMKIVGADPESFRGFEKNTSDRVIIDYEYAKDKNNVYYYGTSRIIGADVNSFKPLGIRMGIDKDNFYLQGKKKDFVDINTLEALTSPKGEPKNYFSTTTDFGFVSDYDPQNYKYLEYLKDKNNVYHYDAGLEGTGFNIVEGADPATFEIIPSGVRDKNNCYYSGNKTACREN